MPTQYDQELIEHCRALYIKYGGKNLDAVEREMQKEIATWRKNNLFDRGKGENFREGWINRYGFDKSLQEHLKIQAIAGCDDVQKLYIGIKSVRETLQNKIKGSNPSRDDIYAYRDFCKLEMEARTKLDLEKDSYEIFVTIVEKILAWLPDIDLKASKSILSGDVMERLLAKAKSEYGDQQES